MAITGFSPGMAAKLCWYVYMLRDPRDGRVFYIGKGNGDRVFQHENRLKTKASPDEETNKENRIRDIVAAGLRVEHVIVRHGMEENEALLLEAALIDLLPNLGLTLTNLVEGHGTGQYGLASPEKLEALYAARELAVSDPALNVILINVNVQFRNIEEEIPLEGVQSAWKISLNKARKANLVLAHAGGLTRGCYVPDMERWRELRRQFPADKLKQYEPEPGCMPWVPAWKKYFPRLEKDLPDRLGFLGKKADPSGAGEFVLRRLPEKYTHAKGNPIQYYLDNKESGSWPEK